MFGLDTTAPPLRQRMFAENFATDSYQNILLSLIQYPIFARQVGTQPAASWPQKLIIVSHNFKKSRFLDLHLPAIGMPLDTVEYIGIDPPFDQEHLAQVIEGDRLRGYGAWKHDLRGTGKLLSDKRRQRGWDEVSFVRDIIQPHHLWDEDIKCSLAAIVRGSEDVQWPG